MNKLIIALIAGIFLFGCTAEEKGNLVINGQISNNNGSNEVYLYQVTTQNAVPIDTAIIDENGAFKLVTDIDKLDFYQLGLSLQNRVNLGLSPNENIAITFNSAQLEEDYTITGSPESEKIKQVIDLQIDAFKKNDSINKAMQVAGQSNNVQEYMRINALAQAEAAKYTSKLKDFATENSSSIASLIAVQQLNPQTDLETFEIVVAALESKMSDHFFYKGVAEQVNALKKVAIGVKAPELAFENPDGEIISLSSLKGKYVLIDFWASWCKPCRQENPNVVKMYEKYHSKGFEILGVSLDQKRDAWLKAIEVDQLTWPQISDLKGWQAEPARIYGVRSIPATVLVDPSGIIVAKDLRGPSLENKLAEVLN